MTGRRRAAVFVAASTLLVGPLAAAPPALAAGPAAPTTSTTTTVGFTGQIAVQDVTARSGSEPDTLHRAGRRGLAAQGDYAGSASSPRRTYLVWAHAARLAGGGTRYHQVLYAAVVERR